MRPESVAQAVMGGHGETVLDSVWCRYRLDGARWTLAIWGRDVPNAARAGEGMIEAWRTHNRVTTYLIECLPAQVWARSVPGLPRRTVRMIAAHIHNSRCRWIKSLGQGHGIKPPRLVDLRRVRPGELARALSRSSDAMIELIQLGMALGGKVPRATWQNFPNDLDHFLTYFVAHEAHHRGQLILLARQLGHRLPREVTDGVWQWTTRSRELR